jgi:hypothetical protein
MPSIQPDSRGWTGGLVHPAVHGGEGGMAALLHTGSPPTPSIPPSRRTGPGGQSTFDPDSAPDAEPTPADLETLNAELQQAIDAVDWSQTCIIYGIDQ